MKINELMHVKHLEECLVHRWCWKSIINNIVMIDTHVNILSSLQTIREKCFLMNGKWSGRDYVRNNVAKPVPPSWYLFTNFCLLHVMASDEMSWFSLDQSVFMWSDDLHRRSQTGKSGYGHHCTMWSTGGYHSLLESSGIPCKMLIEVMLLPTSHERL